jgi:Flp pilus assembly protein protease CpaA
MLKTVPLHAILFGVLPVLCGYSSLVSYLLPEELVIPLAVCFALAVIVLLLSFACLRDWRRAGLVTSALMLMNFSFDAMAAPANRLMGGLGLPQDDRFYLVPFVLLVCLVVYLLLQSKSDYKVATSFLNMLSLVLVVGNVGYIAYHEYKVNVILSGIYQNDDQELAAIHLKKAKNLNDSPDIYYFILDAFGRSDTLKEVYDFDNSSFINALKQRGFVIPSGSRSNYQMTCLSLPSSLNMQYLDNLEKILGRNYTESSVFYRIIQRNRVSSLLKGVGYRYVNVSSGWSPTDYMPCADVNIGFPFGNVFHLALLRSTLVGPLQRDFDFLGWAARRVRLYGLQNIQTISSQSQSRDQAAAQAQVSSSSSSSSSSSPKFVFVHVVVPHPPFLFNEDGSSCPLSAISFSDKFEKEKYVAQVKFLQHQVLAMLDQLDKSPKKKVVIIQGDHGPALQNGSDGNPSPSFLRERMRILNAYRLPDGNPGVTNAGAAYAVATYPAPIYADTIYDGITPVNTFRVVLNRYFDAKLPLLPDKCIYSPNPLPLQFVDVTKEVTAEVRADLPTANLPTTATSQVKTSTH